MNFRSDVELKPVNFSSLISLSYHDAEPVTFGLKGFAQEWQGTHASYFLAPAAFPKGVTISAYPVILRNKMKTPTATTPNTTKQNAAGNAPAKPSDSNLTHM